MRHVFLQETRLLARQLDSELEAWRPRRLEAEAHPYVFVDACYEKARVGHRIASQGVIVVSAVREDGFREIVGITVAVAESEATYQELFRSLKTRGPSGVELVISGDHEGLKAASVATSRGLLTRDAYRSLCAEPTRDGGTCQAQ